MLGEDFNKLNVGDYCTFRTGNCKGEKCKVIWKEDKYALVESVNGNPLPVALGAHRCPYRLANYSVLAIWKEKES